MRVVIAHHSVIEAYAGLTRLPAEYLLSQAVVDVIVTYNVADFARLTRAVRVSEPSEL